MRKTLRVILPILLVIVILVSAAWYLLVYDPDFTRDTILSTAREFDKAGHHKVAAMLYDLAYLQSGGGDEVAIELAEHYKSIGNYTKAEYTLSSAISDGGTVELYIALCRTYVEQDKILDAVNMLANIKDPGIKAQIDEMRPAIPSYSPTPGFYSQYITVSVHSEGSDLYINSNGEYPSTTEEMGRKQEVAEYIKRIVTAYFRGESTSQEAPQDFSTVSVTLPQGETTIYAVAIGNDYLVSELAIQGYTVGGIVEQVKLSDSELDAHIRSLLNYNTGRDVYTNDLWAITELEIPAEVKDFSDLKYFPYLQKLTITGCGAADLSSLTGLAELKELSITDGELSLDSLKAIGTLRSLEKLTLSNCGLSTIAPLESLTSLTYLDLSRNTLRNIDIFSGFTKLQELHMGSNALTDLDAISGLKDLKVLDLSYNSLQSLKPLFGITGITQLNASNNAFETIEGIGALTALTSLNLNQNLLKDISFLSGCAKLEELDVSNNKLEDISVVAQLTSLVRLTFNHNEVTELPQFPEGHKLAAIEAAYNKLSTIEPLKTLADLYFLDIDYNEEVSTLDYLLASYHLMRVNCYGTKIARDPFPEEQGVVVNLDPSIYFEVEP